MRASTRLRVSAPTSAHPRTTLETVITDTLRSRAMSLRRTGAAGVFVGIFRALWYWKYATATISFNREAVCAPGVRRFHGRWNGTRHALLFGMRPRHSHR